MSLPESIKGIIDQTPDMVTKGIDFSNINDLLVQIQQSIKSALGGSHPPPPASSPPVQQ